jgi:hypothetical protein
MMMAVPCSAEYVWVYSNQSEDYYVDTDSIVYGPIFIEGNEHHKVKVAMKIFYKSPTKAINTQSIDNMFSLDKTIVSSEFHIIVNLSNGLILPLEKSDYNQNGITIGYGPLDKNPESGKEITVNETTTARLGAGGSFIEKQSNQALTYSMAVTGMGVWYQSYSGTPMGIWYDFISSYVDDHQSEIYQRSLNGNNVISLAK